MAKTTTGPTTFDPKTTQKMLEALTREAQPPAQRTGIGPVAQPGNAR